MIFGEVKGWKPGVKHKTVKVRCLGEQDRNWTVFKGKSYLNDEVVLLYNKTFLLFGIITCCGMWE